MLLPLLLSPAIASASGDATALDLDLPRSPLFTSAAPFDAPGVPDTDYERVLRERELARRGDVAAASSCPPAADGSERGVTGSFTTGIGHSSRGGNSHWNAADINLCKEYVSNAGNVNTMNMRIHVGQYDGPGYFHGPGSGYGRGYYGPGPHGVHGIIGGRWNMAPSRDESWSEGRRPWR
ncbi:hypothetical protein GCM10011394_15130 [Luteimonas terricola]|uniref:Uncharacterized protein n=2 Tax=Luteimonas terricola TaxID=645597 RepID=A0ABQ2EFF6_9GAMM|nr:hypothetical protein GCM10011394_15130 [Luteimonas terricola]